MARGESFLDPSISREVAMRLLDVTGRKAQAAANPADRRPTTPSPPGSARSCAWCARACSPRKIADALSISIKTVEHHRASIMRKLGLQNTVELDRYAVRIGLID